MEDGEDEVYFFYIKVCFFYFKDLFGNLVEFIVREMLLVSVECFLIEFVLNIGEVNLMAVEVVFIGRKLQCFGILVRDYLFFREDGFYFMGDYNDGVFLFLGLNGCCWIFFD